VCGLRWYYGSSLVIFFLFSSLFSFLPVKITLPCKILELFLDVLIFQFWSSFLRFFFNKFWLFLITSFNPNLWYSIFFQVVLLLLIDFYFWIFFIKLIFLFNFTLQSISFIFLFQIWSLFFFLFNLGHFVNLFFFLISIFHKKLKLFLTSILILIILITIFCFKSFYIVEIIFLILSFNIWSVNNWTF